jgi:SAM-dependent methyltransferase
VRYPLARIATNVVASSAPLRRRFWREWYDWLAKRFGADVDWLFMNYGFRATRGSADWPELDPADERNRLCIQLYHHLTRRVDLAGADVLEVGCGRGGGASYVQRYAHPRSTVGLDFSLRSLEFCRRTHRVPGLAFVQGDAEALPFPNGAFDAVINVESSHCYGSLQRFFFEAARVLRPCGALLYADFCAQPRLAAFRGQIARCPLGPIAQMDITDQVVEALVLDSERRCALVRERIPWPLVTTFVHFAGARGSRVFEEFSNGQLRYYSFVFEKAGEVEHA